MSQTGSGGATPGLLSQFDVGAFGTGLGQALGNMGARYSQLGLGQFGDTPSGAGSFGSGSTAMQMDLGLQPSLTGGIPGEFTAGQGQAQTTDLEQTLRLALNNLNTGATNKTSLLSGIRSL